MSEHVHPQWRSFLDLVRRACEQLFPGIGRYDRVVYGKVVSVSQLAGQVTSAMKCWSCDIQLLNPDLSDDKRRQPIKDVPVDPIDINSSGAALFSTPFVGMIVRVGWMYGNRAYPFIHSFTAEGQVVPLDSLGQFSGFLFDAVQLLSMPRQTAVGPGPYDPDTMAKLILLLQRIPK